jgi:hypothetical protein
MREPRVIASQRWVSRPMAAASGRRDHRRKKSNDRREGMTGSIISGVDYSEGLSVPDVYALLYGDEVDWDAELAELEEDR